MFTSLKPCSAQHQTAPYFTKIVASSDCKYMLDVLEIIPRRQLKCDSQIVFKWERTVDVYHTHSY